MDKTQHNTVWLNFDYDNLNKRDSSVVTYVKPSSRSINAASRDFYSKEKPREVQENPHFSGRNKRGTTRFREHSSPRLCLNAAIRRGLMGLFAVLPC